MLRRARLPILAPFRSLEQTRAFTFAKPELRKHVWQIDDQIIVVKQETTFGHSIRWFWLNRIGRDQVVPVLVFSQDVLTTTPGSNFTYTSVSTWDNTSNSVEMIGAGAKGAIGASTSTGGGGGGGGAYTKVTGFSFATPGTTSATARVGLGGAANGNAGGDSWFNDTAYPSTGTNKVGAKGGAALASGTSATGSAGGAKASAYTNGFTGPATSSGGTGGNGGSATVGGGGGGAGGPRGDGGNGSSNAGGAGNNGFGGSAGQPGNPGTTGGTGNEWNGTTGCGGGGGGSNASAGVGGPGGNYGGGSGGGSRSTSPGSGTPANGVIVLSWPLFPIYEPVMAMQPMLAM